MAREFWAGKPTTARVTGDAFYYVESPAEAAVEKMENAATFRDKVMFSWVALLRDPCCVEALTFRGQHAKDPDLRLTHLKAAVKAGFELWDPVWKEEGDRMTWWGFTATRPYMWAIQALGMEHLDRGDEAAARELFEILLEMNPTIIRESALPWTALNQQRPLRGCNPSLCGSLKNIDKEEC